MANLPYKKGISVMKLGAQLYSVRTKCTTPEDLRLTLKTVKEIGYEVAQASAICAIEPEKLKSYIDEFDIPITCTHRSFAEIVERTDECIRFHKVIGCPVIGLGAMSMEQRASYENVKEFVKELREPIKKIHDAGLRFAYHNHACEFEPIDGFKIYDYLLEEAPEFDFIHDVYWSSYAGEDPAKYIKLLAESGRMTDMHFKDMKSSPKGPICPCGEGVIDFKPLAELAKSVGIKNVHVEQDNAPDLGDVFEQMKSSYDHLAPMFGE